MSKKTIRRVSISVALWVCCSIWLWAMRPRDTYIGTWYEGTIYGGWCAADVPSDCAQVFP